MSDLAPHAVILSGSVYAYGETRRAAWAMFLRHIAGAPAAMQWNMQDRASVVPLDDDEASEVAEMLAADAVRWEAVA